MAASTFRCALLVGLAVLIGTMDSAFADGPDLSKPYGIEIGEQGHDSPASEIAEGEGTVTLTLPSGKLVIYVSQENQRWRCTIEVTEAQDLAWKPSNCKKMFRRRDSRTRFAIELGGAIVTSVVDNYSVALLGAGYDGVGPKEHQRVSGTFFFGTRRLKTGIEASTLEKGAGVRQNPTTGAEETVSWSSLAITLKSRASVDVSQFFLRRLWPSIAVEAFGELGLGLAVARTRFQGASLQKQTHYSPLLQAGIGLAYVFPHGIGVYARIDFTEANTIDDDIYGEHDVGGTGFASGLRFGW
tara:strand:+ start:201 stop:1097 length:897 start_codon:yes stop_codon:yes gene_type:complete